MGIFYRLNEGFDIEDFRKVIDTKVDAWKNDETMNTYLRPATLFGPKFEGYLNEKKGQEYLLEERNWLWN